MNPPRPFVRTALAAVGGVGVAFGFAPFEQLVPLLLGLALAIVALRGASWRRGAWLGLVFGIAFLAVLVSWVHVLGIGVLAALVAVQVPFYVFFGAAFAAVSASAWWPLWGACLWVATEYLRSIVPFGGFPWGRLAFATVGSPLESYARWVGVPALSGIVFAVVAVVAAVVIERRVRTLATAVVALVAMFAVGQLLPTGLADPGRTLQVALVQGDVPGTGADGMGQQRQVLANHVRATEEFARKVDAGQAKQPDLVLWPENASDIDPLADPQAGQQIDAVTRDVGAPLLVGAILDGPRPGTARNVGIAWDPRTGPGETYDKRHLVPYGEYVPFRPLVSTLVPFVTEQIPRDILPGDEPGVIEIGDTTIGDMMCFDVVFDNLARDVVLGGAEILVVQTNNATYLGTSQPEQQWQIARMRAIEAGRQIAVPSTNGVSGIADGEGHTVAKSESGRAQIISEPITTATGITWGTRFGGWIEYALSALALVGLLIAAGRRRRNRQIPRADGGGARVRDREQATL